MIHKLTKFSSFSNGLRIEADKHFSTKRQTHRKTNNLTTPDPTHPLTQPYKLYTDEQRDGQTNRLGR